MPSDPAVGGAGTRRQVLLAAAITVTGIFGSRVLGLVRVMVQSRLFAAGDVGALRAAFDLPDLLFYIVAGGALRSGFVPVFSELLHRGRQDAEQWRRLWWLFSVLISGVFLLSLVIVALGVAFAGPIMAPITGQWSSSGGFSPEARDLTIHLTRLLLPAQLCLLVGGVLSGTLDSMRKFTVTALVPCLYNLCIILAMVLLHRRCGVDSAAYGVILGGLLGHLWWQAAALRREGRPYDFAFAPALAWRDALVQRVVRIAAPIILGLCVVELDLRLCGWVGAQFGEAARAWLDNARNIARLPDGIFGAGLGIALFPFLSILCSEGRQAEYRAQAEHILRLATVCTAPLALFLLLLPYPPTAMLFLHGKYTAADCHQTAALLSCFAVGIVPLTLSLVLTRMFYARSDSLTPLKLGLWTVLFTLLASLALAALMDVAGPPLAFSLSCWFNAALLLAAHRKACGLADGPGLARVALLSHLAAAAAAGVAAAAVHFAPGGPTKHTLLALALLAVVYGGLLRLLRLEEAVEVIRLLRRQARPTAVGGADSEP
jgi:putative peptidoglycan lipid II flippase